MEHSPEREYAFHESPSAATVAAERICSMRYCTYRDTYKLDSGTSGTTKRLRLG